MLTAILSRTTAFLVPVLTFIYCSLNHCNKQFKRSCKKVYEAELSVLNELACSCCQELLALVSHWSTCIVQPWGKTAAWLEILRYQADASLFIAALYFPLISLGNGTKAGQGTWPSISQMHSRRWYFLGPKVAGCDRFFLSLSSCSSVSLEKRSVCYYQKFELQYFLSLPWTQVIRKMDLQSLACGLHGACVNFVWEKWYFLLYSTKVCIMYARWYVSLLRVTYLLFPRIFLTCSVISLLVLSSTSTKTCSPLSVKKNS